MASPPAYPAHEHLGPYLRLSHRLTLAPFAYPIIAVAFVAVRFFLAYKSAQNLVADAKELIIAGCLGAQRAATTAVSIPRWMALETNEQLINVAQGTLDASREGLNLSLTVLDKIIIFVIDSYKSFYLCIFEFLIRGGLAAIITIVQFVENGLNAIGPTITSAVSDAQSGINTAVNAANSLFSKLPGFSSVQIPSLSVPVNSLNVQVPDTVSNSLISLNNSLPTLDDLRNDIANLITIPFTDLQQKINSTFAQAKLGLDPNILPVPALRTVEFCDGIDLSDVDNAGNKLIRVVLWTAIILFVLVPVMMLLNVFLEWYRWKGLQAAVGSIGDSWRDPSDDNKSVPVVALTKDNIMVLHSQLERRFTTRNMAVLRRWFGLRPQTTNSIAWFIAYVTYPPALMCLLIGVLGIVVVAVQYALIGPLQKEFAQLESVVIGNYTGQIADAINNAIGTDSVTYANDVNGWMDSAAAGINNDLFGFATTASNAVNDTIVRFYDDIEDGVRTAFSGTVLADSVIEFLRCVIGNKIFALEDALVWLKQNMHVNLPHVDPTFLQLKASSVMEMATPIGDAAGSQNSSGADNSGILANIIDSYRDLLKGEMILFIVFLGLWGVVVISAICILIYHSIVDGRRARARRRANDAHGMTEKY